MIHLEDKHKAMADEIFRFYLPGATIKVFGSRATGQRLRPQSDIDFLIDAGQRMTLRQRNKIRDAFMLSDLPMRVDIVDAHDSSPEFLDSIAAQLVDWDCNNNNEKKLK